MKRIKPMRGKEPTPADPDEVALFEAATVDEVHAIKKSAPLSGAFADKSKRKAKQIKGLKRSRSYDDPRPALAAKKKRRRKKKKSEKPILGSSKHPITKKGDGRSDKYWEIYHALREKGYDKTKAAKIASTQEKAIAKHGGGSHSDEDHGNWSQGQKPETKSPKKQKGEVDPKLKTANSDRKPLGDGEGSKIKPIVTDDVDEAIKLLAEGKYVELNQPDEVSTLIDKMSDYANEAYEAGEEAKDIDLCRLTVAGSNIFCSDNVGIERLQMPQFSGKAKPGSKAFVSGGSTGEANVGDQFVQHLQDQGIAVTEEMVPASYLRASQNQLIGVKVGGIMDAMVEGKLQQTPIFVSRDNYVIDGHHRWAANVGIDFRDNEAGNYEIPVIKLDVGILDALDMANEFTEEMGILPKGAPKTEDAVEKRRISKHPHDSSSQDGHGNWARGGAKETTGAPDYTPKEDAKKKPAKKKPASKPAKKPTKKKPAAKPAKKKPAPKKSSKKPDIEEIIGPFDDTWSEKKFIDADVKAVDDVLPEPPESAREAATKYADTPRVNNALRYGIKVGDLNKENQAIVRGLDKGMQPFESAVTLYRGVNLGTKFRRGSANYAQSEDMVGQVFTDSGYTSTTPVWGAAAQFGDTVMKLTVPAGTKAIEMTPIGGRKKEREYLLQRDISFQVDSIQDVVWLGDPARVIEATVVPKDIRKHGGPGPHDSGTPQTTHGSWSRGLSADQRIDDIESEEGFTVHYPTGVKPKKGWSVALGGMESKRKVSKLSPDWVRAYRAKYLDELSRPETSWGAWVEGSEAVLDVSIVTDSFAEALKVGRASNQDAIYNLETRETVYLDDEVRIAQLKGPAMVDDVEVAKGLIIGFTPRRRATMVKSMSSNPIAKHAATGPGGTHPGTGTTQQVHDSSGGGVQSESPQANASDEVLGITEKRQNLPKWFEGDTPPPGSYWVADSRLDAVEKKFGQLNRRGAKYGLEPFEMEVVDRHEQVVENRDMGFEDKGQSVLAWSLVKVTGTPPQFEGWEFAGRIEHLPTMESDGEDLFNILHMRPDFEGQLPEQYRNSGPDCEVCNRNVYRKDTFLVHNTNTGEWKQVGRDDLKLFTGDTDPAAAKFYLQVFDDMEDDDFFEPGDGWGNAYISDTGTYLAAVAAEVREHGYVSASSLKDDFGRRMEGGGATTAEIVQDPMYYVGRWADMTPKVTDADRKLADEAQAFYAAYETPPEVAAFREYKMAHQFDDDGYFTGDYPDIYPPDPYSDVGTYGWREGDSAARYTERVDFWKENVMGTPFDPTTDARIEHEVLEGIGVEVIKHQQSVTEKGMRDLYKAESNDSFMSNMHAAAITPHATRSTAGLQAYIVPGYQKHLAQVAIEEARAAQPVSEWVGTVGEKMHFEGLKIYDVKQGVGNSGRDWTLTKMHDQSGNLVNTWYGGKKIYYIDPSSGYETLWKPGDTISGTATVKSHDVDRYLNDQHVTVIKGFLKDTEVEIS